jgi:hypothetical protein
VLLRAGESVDPMARKDRDASDLYATTDGIVMKHVVIKVTSLSYLIGMPA